jgi:hypothetical protein
MADGVIALPFGLVAVSGGETLTDGQAVAACLERLVELALHHEHLKLYPERFESLDIRLDAQAGPTAQLDFSLRDLRERAAEQLAQRIVIGVNFDVSAAANGGFQVHRGNLANAAAEPMRAEQLAVCKGLAADFQTTAEASPFPNIGLDEFQRASLDRAREIIKAAQVRP